MATDEKWYFTKEQLTNTPSRRCGIDADKELSYRQQAANFIQDMGQRLVVYPYNECMFSCVFLKLPFPLSPLSFYVSFILSINSKSPPNYHIWLHEWILCTHSSFNTWNFGIHVKFLSCKHEWRAKEEVTRHDYDSPYWTLLRYLWYTLDFGIFVLFGIFILMIE